MAETKTAANAPKTITALNDATAWIYLSDGDPLSVSITGTVTSGTVIELQHSLDQSTTQSIKSYTATGVFEHEPSMPAGHYRLKCTTYAASGQPLARLWN